MGLALSVRIDSMSYSDGSELIHGLAFDVPKSGIVSLIGRTGAGKSTLLRIIAGLERRFEGEVMLNGTPIERPSRQVQMVFQDYRLLPWKTVYQNIAFATPGVVPDNDRQQIEKWIEIVGLKERRNAWPKTLSGGEAGRVALARAFVDQPQLLLLDEPFRALDSLTKFELQKELLRALEIERTTVVMVSHSIEDAVFMSDAVYVLSDDPMRVACRFDVNVPRSRKRGDSALGHLAEEIIRKIQFAAEGNTNDL